MSSINRPSAVCIECGGSEIKYKCSVCRSATDCLACFKTHASTHSETETRRSENGSATTTTPSPHNPSTLFPLTAPKTSSADQAAAQAPSSSLELLLSSSPELRAKLRIIHSAVRDAESDAARRYAMQNRGGRGGRARGRGRRTPWQRPDDLERGMRALRGLRDEEGREGGVLQSFVELVGKGSGEKAAIYARQGEDVIAPDGTG